MTRLEGSGRSWFYALVGGMFAAVAPWSTLTPTVIHAEPNRAEESTRKAMESTSTVFESVANLVSPAVVYLEATRHGSSEQGEEESGSGVLVRPQGAGRPVVITNYHVVANCLAEDVDILLSDGRLLHPSKIWHDEETDIAVLDPDVDDLPAVRMGNSDDASDNGSWRLAVLSVCHKADARHHRRQAPPADRHLRNAPYQGVSSDRRSH
ncbi:MAG: trypsin-like peptidase domain-containing protein [Planctomycetota bacterium]